MQLEAPAERVALQLGVQTLGVQVRLRLFLPEQKALQPQVIPPPIQLTRVVLLLRHVPV